MAFEAVGLDWIGLDQKRTCLIRLALANYGDGCSVLGLESRYTSHMRGRMEYSLSLLGDRPCFFFLIVSTT
jgi:hypothetical protein